MIIRKYEPGDFGEWLRMRLLLWPDHTREDHARQMVEMLDSDQQVFVAVCPDGRLGGFLEASLRRYADGCETGPVGYIEGWYVDEDLRRRGAGGALVSTAEEWARSQGCVEMGSDCLLDNRVSLAAHLSLGYREAERLIHFCKKLD